MNSLKSKFRRYFVFYLVLTSLTMIYAVTLEEKPLTIYMAGDSTMADKLPSKYPETGWGMVLSSYFDQRVRLENRARNGMSTKTFINQNRWKSIVDNLNPGDYVFIEFGHNDSRKDKPEISTSLEEYRNNLLKFIVETEAKQAIPILMTPLAKRSFKSNGELNQSHGAYPDVVRKIAAERKIWFIDMLEKSRSLLLKHGAEASKKIFLHADSGIHAGYPNGITDNVHFNERGAHEMASLAIQGIKEQNIPLAKYLNKRKSTRP